MGSKMTSIMQNHSRDFDVVHVYGLVGWKSPLCRTLGLQKLQLKVVHRVLLDHVIFKLTQLRYSRQWNVWCCVTTVKGVRALRGFLAPYKAKI